MSKYSKNKIKKYLKKNSWNILCDSQKLDKKSANINDSNLRNVTKTIHVPKRDMSSKWEFASKQWNVLKHDMRPKCVFASKQWNVRKKKKRMVRNWRLSIYKGLMFKLSVSNWSLDYVK